MQVAEYAGAHNMILPDQYNRTIPTLMMDEFADAKLAGNMVSRLAAKFCLS
ncbi:MAG: hypothetical protein H7240_06010 [Glaciimonas sp.]|nr:hypothetical protein [Glaciimonas sp.]